MTSDQRHLIPKELEIITVLPGKTLGGVYLSYYGQGSEMESRLGPIGSKLEVPVESPFAEIGLAQPFLSIHAEQMCLRVRAPEVVGQREIEYIYHEVG